MYDLDKAPSNTSLLRIPERVLHFLALFAGSPLHKTRKHSFQTIFWVVFVFQIAIIAWIFLAFLK
ncbi:MAG: hypothetical protein JXB29_11795 [Sedimentisphaerales bacterium]|nr:hypothetical protein [Sedimentisphaerales bacterium]